MYKHTYTFTYMYTHIHIYIYVHTHTHIHICTHTHTHIHICAHKHTHLRKMDNGHHIHIYVHTHIHTSHIHICTHTHTHLREMDNGNRISEGGITVVAIRRPNLFGVYITHSCHASTGRRGQKTNELPCISPCSKNQIDNKPTNCCASLPAAHT
jgi:hypothetical protein